MKVLFLSIGIFVVGSLVAANRPNVIVIMPDDITHGSLSYYGNKKIRTPNLDRLASQSLRLTDFHVSPTCSQTRAALMTGRYNNATGVWHTIFGRSLLHGDEISMADVFQENGYATGFFGKWHVGENHPSRPKDIGFQRIVRHLGGGTGQSKDYWGNSNHMPSKYSVDGVLTDLTDDDDGIPGALSTNFFTKYAIDFMVEKAKEKTPFFAYIPYNAAHGPIDKMPKDARRGLDWKDAMSENIDKNVGRILRFLDESGLAENTLVVYTTDNGAGGSIYRGGKSSSFDGGHRVPCFVRWPAAKMGGDKGREVNLLTAHIDLLPTFMDLFSLKDVPNRAAEVAIHGRSIASFLNADPTDDDTSVQDRAIVVDNQRVEFLQKYRNCSVMRDEIGDDGKITAKWRLMRDAEKAPWQLFNVAKDKAQKKNLAGKAAYVKIKKGLASDYEVWWKETSIRANDYVRPVLGHKADPRPTLWGFDWHEAKSSPWSQRTVARGVRSNGFWTVEVAKAGTYRFDLRRWPRELADATTITSGYAKPLVTGEVGVALPIASARIRIFTPDRVIAEASLNVEPDADGVAFTMPELPAGPCRIQTWFFDAEEKEIAGAYYVYVNH